MAKRSRPEVVAVRLTTEERRDLEALAARRTGGNLAELIRSRIVPWVQEELVLEFTAAAGR